MKYKFLLIAPALLVFQSTCYGQGYVDFYNKSLEAYKGGDYEKFLENTIKADIDRPNHPMILYNLAGGYALNHNPEKALEILNYRSHFYASDDFQSDEDFVSLKNLPKWDELSNKIDQLNEEAQESTEAFHLHLNGFHPEGITYNYLTSQFIIGDIRNGLIYIFDKYGEEKRLLIDLKAEGYWSAMGMAIDPTDKNKLWVSSAYLPNFSNYKKGVTGKSAVLEINLTSGKITGSYLKEGNHIFGDLVVTKNKEVYVTDSAEPIVYKIDKHKNVISEFLRNENWWNLQGLALSDDESKLYVADYVKGVYVIDFSNPNNLFPLINNNEWLRGGDGLYQKNNNLIILQNGTLPKRVAQIKLDKDGLGIMDSLHFTDQAVENLNEPTLGTWVNKELFYIANSPWGFYNDKNKPDLENWPTLKIFKLVVK